MYDGGRGGMPIWGWSVYIQSEANKPSVQSVVNVLMRLI